MPKILAIDDDKLVRKLYEEGFVKAGYEIITAESGEEGIKMAQDNNPDVILLDLLMPEMSGEEVLKNLKEKGVLEKIPVIVLSSKSDEETLKNCMGLGAKDYLTKVDFSFDVIIEKIKKVIS